ncbi:MAG: DNA primase [Pseudomonadota bacterium]|nr:DNA primase [Pseudomonadota bacterium]
MSRIPQSFIDEVIHRVDLVELIKARITLKKAGQTYTANCPFHNEKTPSFHVYPVKQFFHCFGCGANGNALGFVIAYDRLDFLDALENLASKVGLELPERGEDNDKHLTKSLISILREAAKFYYRNLQKSQIALDYAQKRGLTKEVIHQYGIGYAPPGWDLLLQAIGQSAEARQLLFTAGMSIEKQTNHYYDRFRDRLMFPIRNLRGQVIGFGGRTLGEDTPKYLNSPETPLFHKGTELYGLYEARQANKDLPNIIIVEGYMDVVALAQFGINNAVATLGTATTTQHIQRLFRYTNDVVFCFDGDNAGQKASIRALETALPVINDGYSVAFIHLPPKDDPDSFIRAHGVDAWRNLVKNAKPMSDVLFEHLTENIDAASIAGKAKFAHATSELLSRMPEGVYQQLLRDDMAKRVGLTANDIASKQKIERPVIKQAQPPISPVEIPKNVRNAISLLLHQPYLATKLQINDRIVNSTLPGIDTLVKLIEIICNQPTITTGGLLSHYEEKPERALLGQLAAKEPLIPTDAWLTELTGSLQRIEESTTENAINTLMQKAAAEGLSGAEKQKLQQLLSQ